MKETTGAVETWGGGLGQFAPSLEFPFSTTTARCACRDLEGSLVFALPLTLHGQPGTRPTYEASSQLSSATLSLFSVVLINFK